MTKVLKQHMYWVSYKMSSVFKLTIALMQAYIMVITCSVISCHNNSLKLKRWKQLYCFICEESRQTSRCMCEPPFRLFSFPTSRADKENREKWKMLVNRQTASGQLWSPKKDSKICSTHFVDKEPTARNPYPSLNLGYDDAGKRVQRLLYGDLLRQVPPKKKVKASATDVLHDQLHTRVPDPDEPNLLLDSKMATSSVSDPPDDELATPLSDFIYLHWTWFSAFLTIITYLFWLSCRYFDQARQLNHRLNNLRVLLTQEQIKVNKLKAQVEKLKIAIKENGLSSKLLKTDADVNFFTGIRNKALFSELLCFVSPYIKRRWHGTISVVRNLRQYTSSRGPQRQLSKSDEFLLTLMKLRLGLLNKDLAARFSVSATLCSRIFFSWIRGMSTVLGSLVYMPDMEELSLSKPTRFCHLPDIHSIIDCSELFIETPKDLQLQAASWSDYKHHNTLKFLIAVAPNSMIMFTSNAYCGRVGDKALTLDCGYLDMVPAYSMVLADKGFNIAKECADRCVSLHVPPGKRGQTQMTSAAVRKTKRIANLRILVEQVIREIKTFRILKTELPVSLIPHIDDIITVCCALVNWKKSVYET